MRRSLALFGWFHFFMGFGAWGQLPGNSFSSYYGQNYLIPTELSPCHSASFRDHGESVRLCIDNFGRPIPIGAEGASSRRNPSSIGKK